jgi:[acyl-carrier-protein] S-malonyltransferase
MKSITPDFQRVLDQTPFAAPRIPVVSNVGAAPLKNVDEIRSELGAQLTSTVRWTESVQFMRQAGVDTFIELGSKDVLSGLIKRIDRATTRVTLNSAASLADFLATQS